VIRKLPPLLNSHPLFCGLTLSGASETAMLLDADRLSQFNQSIATVSTGDNRGTTDTQLKLLVADDSMSARKLLVKKLLSLGFHVTEAGDGVEALEKIRNQKFDLVFTDLDMPRLGGMELLFDLKQGQHKDQAVVVVSSRDATEFRDRATELGAVGYIQKPVTDSELNKTLLQIGLIS
jgi:CheY-like chemotaxis protein